MKPVRYLRRAITAMRRHRNRADLIEAKIAAYAADPTSQANNVKALAGSQKLRLRVGDFRVIFEDHADEVVVLDIGPRGDVYD